MARRVLIQTRVLANAGHGDIVTAAELGFSSEDKLDGFIAAGLGIEIHVDVPPAAPPQRLEPDPPAAERAPRTRRGTSDDQSG